MSSTVIAIDGPSGSGKSSTAKAIALRANWNYLDTGALYRAVTWIALDRNISNPRELVRECEREGITFNADPSDPRILVGSLDVSEAIRSLRITDQVSVYAQMSEVREYLLHMQREIIHEAKMESLSRGAILALWLLQKRTSRFFSLLI